MERSTASLVRERLEVAPSTTFVVAAEIDAPVGAVEAELSRLARRGSIVRVRKGLYWKGPRTRLGIARPDPEQIALHVVGRGGGPAGITAASWLGLTTQVPGRPTIAVPGRAPTPIPGVRFSSRAFSRRELGLTPLEVAVIEVLRDWPDTVEADIDAFGDRLVELIATGQVRFDKIVDAVAAEHHVGLRERWAALRLVVG